MIYLILATGLGGLALRLWARPSDLRMLGEHTAYAALMAAMLLWDLW